MRTNFVAAALVLAVPILTTDPATAQQTSSADFVEKVVISDMFEIRSGNLAADQAESDEVRSFGEKMVDDHKKTSDELRDLIEDEELKVDMPNELDQDHQGKLDNLKKLSGNKFDKTYVPMQVKAHEAAVDLFKSFAKNGDNDELKEWAEDTLPALKNHLEEAKALNEKIDVAPETAAKEENNEAAQDTAALDEAARNETARSDIKFVTRQEPKDWSAQALIGRTVENAKGENLGDINNVILNEKGSVVAVTIGVGGFLGIGEKDVGVPFDALKFRVEDSASEQTSASKQDDGTASRFDTEHDNIGIVLDATQEQLENAPQFVWLDEQNEQNAGDERVVR